jgi:hypothetical protein
MAIARYKFSDIFQDNPDGTLSPKIKISINGAVLGPGLTFKPGVVFGGIDFYLYRNLDVAGEYVGDTLNITGFYKS